MHFLFIPILTVPINSNGEIEWNVEMKQLYVDRAQIYLKVISLINVTNDNSFDNWSGDIY